MKAYITSWLRNHPDCTNAKQPFLPTRLLDLKPLENSQDIKLVMLDSKQSQSDYVTLSHC